MVPFDKLGMVSY